MVNSANKVKSLIAPLITLFLTPQSAQFGFGTLFDSTEVSGGVYGQRKRVLAMVKTATFEELAALTLEQRRSLWALLRLEGEQLFKTGLNFDSQRELFAYRRAFFDAKSNLKAFETSLRTNTAVVAETAQAESTPPVSEALELEGAEISLEDIDEILAEPGE